MIATKLKVASALFLSSFIAWLILILLFSQPTDSVGQLQFSNFTLLALFLGSAIAASISSMSIGLNLLEVKIKPIGIAQKLKIGRFKRQTKKPVPVLQKQQKKPSTKQLRKSQISQPMLDAGAPSSEEEIILPDASLSTKEKVLIKNLEEISGDHEKDVVQVESNMLSQPSANAILKKPNVEKEKSDEASIKETNVDSKDISCPECSKVFRIAMVALDYSSGTAKMVKLCPYCNSVIDSSEDNKTELASCHHWFGYLRQKDIVTIPDECLDCKKVMECMLEEAYSNEAVGEIKKWMH